MPSFSGVLDRQGTTTTYDSGATSHDRGLSNGLWENIEARGDGDFRYGTFWFDDFTTIAATGATVATDKAVYVRTQGGGAGTFARLAATADTNHWGIAEIDSADGDAGDGVNLQTDTGPVVSCSPGMQIVYESRIQLVDLDTEGPDFFIGLSVVDTTVMSSAGDVTSADNVGFNCGTNDGVLLFEVEDSDTPVVGATSPHTLLDGATVTNGTEWVKLGFRINGQASGANAVEVFVNGKKKNVAFASDPVPPSGDVILVPTIVCQASGSTDIPKCYVDWIALGTTSLATAGLA